MSHMKLTTQISLKLFAVEKNVSNKTYVSRETFYGNHRFCSDGHASVV